MLRTGSEKIVCCWCGLPDLADFEVTARRVMGRDSPKPHPTDGVRKLQVRPTPAQNRVGKIPNAIKNLRMDAPPHLTQRPFSRPQSN
jgi:hypothetical protein